MQLQSWLLLKDGSWHMTAMLDRLPKLGIPRPDAAATLPIQQHASKHTQRHGEQMVSGAPTATNRGSSGICGSRRSPVTTVQHQCTRARA